MVTIKRMFNPDCAKRWVVGWKGMVSVGVALLKSNILRRILNSPFVLVFAMFLLVFSPT